jgi:hypothetical protein
LVALKIDNLSDGKSSRWELSKSRILDVRLQKKKGKSAETVPVYPFKLAEYSSVFIVIYDDCGLWKIIT